MEVEQDVKVCLHSEEKFNKRNGKAFGGSAELQIAGFS